MVFSRVIAVTLLMTNIAAYASGLSSGGKVVHVSTVGDAVIFNIEGNTESNRPSCATSGRFAAHKDSVHVPVILAAFTTEKELANVGGTGACTNWGNAEDVQYVEVCPTSGCSETLTPANITGVSRDNYVNWVGASSASSSDSHFVEWKNQIADPEPCHSRRTRLANEDKELLSLLLAARLADKKVGFYYSTTTTTGSIPGHGSDCQIVNAWLESD